jgi:hypothetical protein
LGQWIGDDWRKYHVRSGIYRPEDCEILEWNHLDVVHGSKLLKSESDSAGIDKARASKVVETIIDVGKATMHDWQSGGFDICGIVPRRVFAGH